MQTPTTTVLVTGATGFIGRALVQRLLERRCRVHTFSRQVPEQGPDGSDCLGFQGDICDAEALNRACAGVDIIFHLAAYAHVNQHDTVAMRETNVDGTQALLDAALKAGVRRVVYFSSSLADEAKYPELTAYGKAKRDAEQLLLNTAKAGNIEVCCLRPVSVYGLGMKGNLRTMIRLLQKGLLPPLPVPSAALSLVGCGDLCEAALLAADAPQANRQVYAVTDGKTYTVKGLEISIRKAMGRAEPKWHIPLPMLKLAFTVLELASKVLPLRNAPGLRTYHTLTTDSVFSCEKIQQELGYQPASSFTQEIATLLLAEHPGP